MDGDSLQGRRLTLKFRSAQSIRMENIWGYCSAGCNAITILGLVTAMVSENRHVGVAESHSLPPYGRSTGEFWLESRYRVINIQ